jgi:hypothetical protein
MKKASICACVLIGIIIAIPGFGGSLTIGTGVNTDFLYTGGMTAVVTPSLVTGAQAAGESTSVEGTLALNFGYRYFVEGRPVGFFVESARLELTSMFGFSSPIGWGVSLSVDTNLRNFPLRTAITPTARMRYDISDLLCVDGGVGFEMRPWDFSRSAILPGFGVGVDLSAVTRIPLTITYSGEVGVRLNDYFYRVPNPELAEGEPLLVSTSDWHPYLSSYGHRLRLGLPLGPYLHLYYMVGNQFVFYNEFDPDGTPRLVLSKYETLKTLRFSLDLVYHTEEAHGE